MFSPIEPPGTSTSLNSPGIIGVSSPFILRPLVFNPPGKFDNVSEKQRKSCFVVYLDIDRKVRESRLHTREDKNDSIKRRLDSDEIDFQNLSDYDLRITDPEFNADDVYGLMY